MNRFKDSFLLFLLVASLGIATPSIAQQNPNANGSKGKGDISFNFSGLQGAFRGIPWGATKEYVLKNDPFERKETGEDYLVLTGRLGDIKVDATYIFWRDHLIKGTYITSDNFGDFANHVERYRYLKDLLADKYGRPKLDLQNWINITYKSMPDRYLNAISEGHLKYMAFWQQDRIIISIEFAAIDKKPVIKIEYYIENFDAEMDQTDDTEVLRDLR